MASFMVIYLKETLGMSPSFATFLNGSLLWGLIYFLPILSAAPWPTSTASSARCSVSLRPDLAGLPGHGQRAATLAGSSAGRGRGSRLHRPGRAGHRPHRPRRLDRQALHRRHGPEDGRDCAPRWASASSTWSSTSARSPAAASPISSRTSLGIPAIFTYGAPRLRPGRPADRAVRLPRAAVRPATARRTARPVQKRTLGQALLGIFTVLKNMQVRLLPGRHRHVLVPLRPALQPHAAVPALRRPRGPDGALYPGQPDHDRLASSC
ncbi:MAG: hypothetical protein MZV64_63205 [Ignavibacteriales bacterium]|nr:hypothetical protein [Ignavibacteriales bacterium]